MHPKPVALVVLILFVLTFSQVRAASVGSSEPQGELVVVLNQEPTNPLGGEIWLMDLGGRLVRRITKNNYHEESPKYSPDGSRIAFVRNLGGVVPGIGIDSKLNEIFVYDLRTGVERQLTSNDVEDGHPEWSYDGKRIAFHSRRNHSEAKATIWIMEADGSYPRQLTSIGPGDLSQTDPVWSPDGQWLAFVNHREEAGTRYSRIEKVRMDGSQRIVVSSGGKDANASGPRREEPLGDFDPGRSPDGTMMWSARRLGDGRVHLFAFGAGVYYGGKAELDMNGHNPTEVVERSPHFSPDGRRILLTHRRSKGGPRNRQIVLMDPQSSFRRFVTSREDWDAWHPSWHPFAQSGAEREGASRLTQYRAKGEESASLPGDPERQGAEEVRFASSPLKPAGKKSDSTFSYEVAWELDVRPERVISLALHFEGRLKDETGLGKVLSFQLMDWQEKSWVTVFSQPEMSDGPIRIYHEYSAANFIHPATRQVKLRLIAQGSEANPASPLQTGFLSLEVRKE